MQRLTRMAQTGLGMASIVMASIVMAMMVLAVSCFAPFSHGQHLKNKARAATPSDANPANEILGITQSKPASGMFVETELGYMIPYKRKIPGTDVVIEMIPIPGGKFKMGSPADAENKYEDETPQVEISVPPFWMAKTATSNYAQD